jgi:uroporphyrinogen-III decarboxylase
MMLFVGERPALASYACDRLLEIARRDVRVAAAIGAAGVWIEDCMTDIISASAFRQLNLPFLRSLTAEIAACGMVSIHYFCGDPTRKWELLLDTGADALSLEESKKGFEIDIDDVVDLVGGRLVVFGNLDAIHLLEQGSAPALRAEVGRQIRAGRRNGSRFVASLGSPVTPGTPPERVRLYIDLAHELGSR